MTPDADLAYADKLGLFGEAALLRAVRSVPQEQLARHTTFRIGGACDLYVRTSDTDQIVACCELAQANELPVLILGGGSNILVSDDGVRGIVISNQARRIRLSSEQNELGSGRTTVIADSGAPLAGLARWCIRRGLSGLEWAVSVPGSVGGAIIGNAGAYGGEIRDRLAWSSVWIPSDGIRRWGPDQFAFGYRSSILKKQYAAGERSPVILKAAFGLPPGDRMTMAARADEWLQKRRSNQPVEPSAGSIFKNPSADYAGRLVEVVGLKGYRIGGAQISPRHGNFIVNLGQAQAADVVALMDLMRKRVHDEFGVILEPEIGFVGRWRAFPILARLCEIDNSCHNDATISGS